MIRISQLRLPCGSPDGSLEAKIGKTLRAARAGKKPSAFTYTIARHSVDARKKPQLFDTYTVDVATDLGAEEERSLVRRLKNKNVQIAQTPQYRLPVPGEKKLTHRPVIVGAGPAGLFCALFLAENGYRPLLLERGMAMEERTAAVERFWKTGILDPGSNVQFGEGGAGTFSDGKLNTQINDRTGRSDQVLRAFVQAGAPESILYEGKPHIGTDRLRVVIPNLRRRIEKAGGEIRFQTLVTGFSFADDPSGRETADSAGNETGDPVLPAADAPDGQEAPASENRRQLKGLYVRESFDPSADPVFIPAEVVVLAVGHSARDTIEEIFREKIPLEQKQFAVGLRVAHPQSVIDQSQYGCSDPEQMSALRLEASPYKLTAHAASGRGVYSFCMCPGGYIVNASSEEGRLCVNGMSDEKRDSGWANSAIVITVGEKEFGSGHVLAGMEFQRELEQKAWQIGKGCIPIQSFPEYRDCFLNGSSFNESGREPENLPDRLRGACRKAPLHTLLPAALTQDFIEGMESFGHRIDGFDGPQALLAGVESRTSSPVRIPRDDTFQSVGVRGLYPCGEGAGYAGGIMSAAMDGIRIAEAIIHVYEQEVLEQ